MARPGYMVAKVLFGDRALAYRFLGNAMNRNRNLNVIKISPISTNGNWTLKAPRLLRKLTALMDSGRLDVSSDNVTRIEGENLDRQLGDLQENTD